MPHPRLSLLDQLERQAVLHQRLTEPTRLAELEAFRAQLLRLCGEEPMLSLCLEGRLRGPEDLADIALTDYLGVILKARHSALYAHQGDGAFACLAAFGLTPGPIQPDGVLLPWLIEQGPLVRAQLSLEGLSAEEGARLLQELDALEAELVVPLGMGDGLWGLLVVGPSLDRAYGAYEVFRLSFYAWRLLQAMARQAQHLPTRSQRRAQEQEKAVRTLQTLWEVMKPPQGLRLLLLDEMPKVVEQLSESFRGFGFEVAGCASEQEAIRLVETFSPHLLLLDLSLNRRLPVAILTAALHHVPQAVILGMSTGQYEEADAADQHAVARELGVQAILPKPLDLVPLTQLVLEAAMRLTVPEPKPAGS